MLANADTRRLLTVREVADRLQLHEMTVRRMIAEGRIPAVQLGGRGTSIRVPEAELERWLFADDDVTRLERGILAAIECDDAEELARLRSEYRRVGVLERPVSLQKEAERDGLVLAARRAARNVEA